MSITTGIEISLSDLLLPGEYAKVRNAQNIAVIEIEKKRRVSTRTFSFLFESRETVLNQVQEMMYLENVTSRVDIEDLLKTYSDLLPTGRSLSVSMFIEFESERQMVRLMKELTGVENEVYLVFDSGEVKAEPEKGRSTETLESTLQYLRFNFSDQKLASFKKCSRCTLEVRRKDYEEIGKLSDQLLSDLKDELH